MKFFDKGNNRLVFIEQNASSNFWDEHWHKAGLGKTINPVSNRNFVCRFTKKYLQPGARILEGGCGRGQYVYKLSKMGYEVYGVDFAEKTVKKIKQLFPNLKVIKGDVRNLPFEENFFDAHWSLGVIEHFYDGFDEIIKEMRRTLIPDGFVFITFPHMSTLRRLKSKLNIYPVFVDNEKNKQLFYQFAFDENSVIRLFLREGFILKEKKELDGFKGLKDEIKILEPILQKINNSPTLFSKIIRHSLSHIFGKFSSHIILLVFQKKENE